MSTLLLLFGGTFDPIHRGHIACAQAAGSELNAAEVRLVPAALPPHRSACAPAKHRAAMVELAVTEANATALPDVPQLATDRCELRRAEIDGAPSYTLDTLAEVRSEEGESRPLCLLLGADVLGDLPDWHQWRKMPQLTHIAALPRLDAAAGDRLDAPQGWQDTRTVAALSAHPCGLFFALQQTPLLDISATQIRTSLANGTPAKRLLPAAVCDYILQQNLYRTSAKSTANA